MTSSTVKRALSAFAVAIALVALPAIYVRAQIDGSGGGWMGPMMSGCGGMMGGGERPNHQWRR
jgi:hypothetical protein